MGRSRLEGWAETGVFLESGEALRDFSTRFTKEKGDEIIKIDKRALKNPFAFLLDDKPGSTLPLTIIDFAS